MNTSDVAKLREETGAGVMDCQRALKDAAGDFEKAKQLIIERGADKATKRAERKTGSGTLASYLHNGRIGVLVEVRCETDFVAQNSVFQELAHQIAMQIASMDPSDITALMEQLYVKDESLKISDLVNQAIAKTGENIRIERFCRYGI